MLIPQTYRKRPIDVEAMQWTGNNAAALVDWCGSNFYERSPSKIPDSFTASIFVKANSNWLGIITGEWVVKDRHGLYPIKPDVFAETYDLVPT